MQRRSWAWGIILVWLGAMGWLLKREYWRTEATELREAALTVAPGAGYYRLLLGEEQIGFASSTVDTTADGISVQDAMVIELPVLGALERTDIRTVALLNSTLGLKEFTLSVQRNGSSFAASGVVRGDSSLSIELLSAGGRQEIIVPIDGAVLLPTLIPLRIAFGGGLEVGRTFAIPTFDPLLFRQKTVNASISADSTFIVPDSAVFDSSTMNWVPAHWDTLPAWRIEQKTGDVASEAWIDQLGRIVKASSPVGFRMERTSFELAYENLRRRRTTGATDPRGHGNIIRQTAIASNASLEGGLLVRLEVRLSDVDLSALDLDDTRQEVRGDTLRILRESTADLHPGYRLPYRAGDLREYLEPEPLLQSDDPRIQAQARQIVGRTRNPLRAARMLNEWVHDRLVKEAAVAPPSAVQVLGSRKGDSNEHTVLYVALARALGLPARTAAGLLYLNGKFYYHAWPEVWVGRWMALDPTLGQFPADASHLRFNTGGLAGPMELLTLIGNLSIDVVKTQSQE